MLFAVFPALAKFNNAFFTIPRVPSEVISWVIEEKFRAVPRNVIGGWLVNVHVHNFAGEFRTFWEQASNYAVPILNR